MSENGVPSLMEFHEATENYYNWLKNWIAIDEDGRKVKAKKMRKDAFTFFRGTFYRWIAHWRETHPLDDDTAPVVFSVGDIHLENFGLWRDREGRLVWGVNDFDEAVELPYLQDIVRLCVSAALASEVKLSLPECCAILWKAYKSTLTAGAASAAPIVLGQKDNDWLMSIARHQLRDAENYFADVLASKKAVRREESEVPAAARAALLALWPDDGVATRLTWYQRTAGVGSLGRYRYALAGVWRGGILVREAKALAPSAWFFASGVTPVTFQMGRALHHPLRSPDPYMQVIDQWVGRRIAPDCDKLDLEEGNLPLHNGKLVRLDDILTAMGHEVANIHLGCNSPQHIAAIVKHAEAWDEKRLLEVVEPLLVWVQKDYDAYKQQGTGR